MCKEFIEIMRVPPGNLPLEVREAMVGLVLPVSEGPVFSEAGTAIEYKVERNEVMKNPKIVELLEKYPRVYQEIEFSSIDAMVCRLQDKDGKAIPGFEIYYNRPEDILPTLSHEKLIEEYEYYLRNDFENENEYPNLHLDLAEDYRAEVLRRLNQNK